MATRLRRTRTARGGSSSSEQTEALLAAIVNSSQDAIYSGDMDGILLTWNAGAERLYGYAAAEMVGHTVAVLTPPGREEELRGIMDGVRSGRPPSHIETVRRRKDGTLIPVAMTISPVRNTRGVIIGASVIARNISERLRAEAERQQAESQYRELVEGVRDVVFSLAPDGTITSLNPAFDRITGMRAAEWIGRPFVELLHPDDLARAQQEYRAALREEHLANPPLRIRTVNGGWRAGEFHLTPHRHEGRLISVLGIGRDVSERMELEGQLRQAQKMEAVGRLAGGIAHDFNNLLTVIISSGQFLLESQSPDDPGRADTEEIVKAGQRAAELTRQLLAFSRRQVLEPKTLDLNQVVGDLERLLRRLIGEDVRLLTIPGRDLGLVRADPGQIEQVVANLVVNARDAMPGGGTLTILTRNIERDSLAVRTNPAAARGPYVVLSVRDTGTGMSEDVKNHVFEPFFTTKDSGKGTGLGLSTAFGIVQQSGGFIRVETELGRGTMFEVYLPRVDAASTTPERGGAPGPLRGTETVLVVEDNRAVRDLAVRVLRGYGYTVLDAEGGEAGLLVAERHAGPIALLISDVVMPGMGGRALAERLGAARPGLKVLYVSGYADDSISRQGLLERGIELLQKPFTSVTLAQRVRQVLDRQADAGSR